MRDFVFVLVLGAAGLLMVSRGLPALARIEAALAEESPAGTPARVEREFKLAMVRPAGSAALDVPLLVREIHASLQRGVLSPLLQAPSLTESGYYVGGQPMVVVSRDVYFDTSALDMYRLAISYRLRHRFRTIAQLLKHEFTPTKSKHFPYRCEIQCKLGRRELDDGFSEVLESRFEFWNASAPFSPENPAPKPPWPVHEYAAYAIEGRWGGLAMTPGINLARALKEAGLDRVAVSPSAVVVSERHRMHLNIKTDYGSGPNPEQAFIVTLDHSEIYEAASYYSFLTEAYYEQAYRPAPVAMFDELEIEFERNVSTSLDRTIEETGEPGAVALRAAFLNDQKSLRQVLEESLARKGIALRPVSRSKYQGAIEVLGMN